MRERAKHENTNSRSMENIERIGFGSGFIQHF
jgi:hypothetical protein